jgi:hypothetical protein
LPALEVKARSESRLRDFVYAILFATLPWIAWLDEPSFAFALSLAEIILTLWDFTVEYFAREQLGRAIPRPERDARR